MVMKPYLRVSKRADGASFFIGIMAFVEVNFEKFPLK
jgi:hypothetical protein